MLSKTMVSRDRRKLSNIVDVETKSSNIFEHNAKILVICINDSLFIDIVKRQLWFVSRTKPVRNNVFLRCYRI